MDDKAAIGIGHMHITQHAPPCRIAPPEYPYTFLRVYHCGHASELVEVSNRSPIVHTLVPSGKWHEDDKGLEYTLERCRQCTIELREQHRKLHEGGKKPWLRPMAAYQGEVIIVDKNLLREARREFEARLRHLNQEENSEEEEDDDGILGIDDSADVISEESTDSLDERSDTDSSSTTTKDLEETLPTPRGEMESDLVWTDFGVMWEERQRKDSGFEVDQSIEVGREDHVLSKVQLTDDTHPSKTTSSNEPLDFYTFSQLVRNNDLSFDEIADLVTHTTTASPASEPTTEDIPQVNDEEPVVLETPSDTLDQVPEQNVRFRQLLDPRSPLIASFKGRSGFKPRNDLPHGDTFSYYYEEESPTILQMLQSNEQFQESAGQDVPKSSFSSDSSVASFDCTPEEDDTKTKGKAWWKPKRKQDVTHELFTTAPIDGAMSLWKRMSGRTSKPIPEKDTIPTEEVEKKLQAKYLEAEKPHETRLGTVADQRVPTSPRKNPNLITPGHILSAMRTPILPHTAVTKLKKNARQSGPKLGKPHQTPIQFPSPPRPTSSSRQHIIKARPRGLPRPYRPSPLKNVRRVTSLDVNKGLPPLPPDRRTHQTAKRVVKGVAGVRKVAIRRVINEYVGDMARAY